ncbi:MAG: hypothetical protein J0M12_13025 [Deltaproteobacteria bacterium]|nr:hypothetical protein [Deltaproteobacteria bacterium]
MTFKCILVLAVSVIAAAVGKPSCAGAEDGVAPPYVVLEEGLPMAEVLKRWGAPKERVEREAKRQEVWRYTNSQVLFENGKVRSWKSSSQRARAEVIEAQPTVPPTRAHPQKPLKQETITEILDELKGYGSSSPGAPSTGAELGMPQGYIRPTPMGMYPGRPELNMPPD